MIKLLPRTLYQRLSVAFALLLFLFAGGQYLLLSSLVARYITETNQRLNWDLADQYSRRLRPLLKESGAKSDVLTELARLEQLNPRVNLYLVDQQGLVLSLFQVEDSPPVESSDNFTPPRIVVEPIEKFLKLENSRELPLLGEDPRRPGTFQPISVARLDWKGKPIYLYAVLFSDQYRSVEQGTHTLYVLWGGIATTVALTLFMLGIGLLVFLLITRRFRSITQVVHAIAGGDLAQRVPESGDDEIATLGDEINQMANSLCSTIAELEDTDRRRRELVADVSHDLGGPLSSMVGYLALLDKEYSTMAEEKRREYIKTALRNVRSMAGLSAELLELSKLEAKEIEPYLEAFSVLDIVTQEVLPIYSEIAQGRGIKLEVEHPEDLPFVYADSAMIERVLSNLLGNAVRYHQGNGLITVILRLEDDGIMLAVSDDGPGIAAEELPHIFSREYRGASNDEDLPGSGLGLAIVKQLLGVHGIDIKVESSVGKGSDFSFTLPIAKLLK